MTVLDNQNNQNYQNGFLIYNKEFIFKGKFLSSEQFKIAEICFNTSMTGYQETLTDPSYKSPFIVPPHPRTGSLVTSWRARWRLKQLCFSRLNVSNRSASDCRTSTPTLCAERVRERERPTTYDMHD